MLSSSRAAARHALSSTRAACGQAAQRSAVPSVTRAASPVASTSQAPPSKCTPGARQDFHSAAPRHIYRKTVREGLRPFAKTDLTPAAGRDVKSAQAWLRKSFPAFSFPDELVMQMITHESHDRGKEVGHNRRLSFLGRRALRFYVHLFLAQCPDCEELMETIDDLSNTRSIGERAGRSLKLEEVMRWTPAIDHREQTGPSLTGLFKIRGVAVQALLGSVYHQYGAEAARHFFSAHILSYLPLPQSDVDRLHAEIEQERKDGVAFLDALLDSRISTATAVHASSQESAVGLTPDAVAASRTSATRASASPSLSSSETRETLHRRAQELDGLEQAAAAVESAKRSDQARQSASHQ